jgi:hypothetical protein
MSNGCWSNPFCRSAQPERDARPAIGEQDIEPVIPHKQNEWARHDPTTWFDRWAYRGRCVAEQCVGWLKEFRRIGTRFEKPAVHFHGMLQLAMIRRYLKLLFSDSAWCDLPIAPVRKMIFAHCRRFVATSGHPCDRMAVWTGPPMCAVSSKRYFVTVVRRLQCPR